MAPPRLRDDSWRIFGVEFVSPLVSRERKLQTVAVATYMYLFLLLPSATIVTLYYLYFYTSYYWLVSLYLAWMVYDRDVGETGGRQWCIIRSWCLWNYFRDYFPITLVKTAELDAEQSYLFGSHPHGILCFGAFAAFSTDSLKFSKVFPGLYSRVLTLKQQFWLPGNRELISSAGLCSATKRGMEALLRQPRGSVAVLVVGGATEVYNRAPDEIELYLTKRKGFIKLALRHGRDLVPVFSFGEAFIYDQVANPVGSALRKFQDLYEKLFAYPLPIIYGRGLFQYHVGFIPYRKPITVVVGKPVNVPKIEFPTVEDINEYHDKYVAALKDLYDEYNPVYGDPQVKLVIH